MANKKDIEARVPSYSVYTLKSSLRMFYGSVCHYHNPVLSSFMTYHRICNKRNTTGVTRGAGIAYYHCGGYELTTDNGLCVSFSVKCFEDHCLPFGSLF